MPAKKKGSENIRVVIRTRNLLENELQRGDKQSVKLDLATQQVIVQHAFGDPDTFAFDAVYNNTFTQRDIFLQEVQPLLESVLQGYNATVFAYGQSGSGKTYTMTGNVHDKSLWGMMPQTVDYLFQEIKKLSSSSKTYKVKVTYVELYNGKSRDLLASKQVNLEIKENMAKNFYVKGAEMPEITTFEECMRYFDAGTNRRQTASTDLNDHSSRSHALFSLIIDQMDFEQDPSSPIIMSSKINIVDLAGSEKLSKTNATGETMNEGCNINLSLSALATVIDTIVKGGKHIPYRGNGLTMLLKDSLGGNAKTVMFANVGPSEKNVAETISTLRFAMRAKQIENKPIKNMDPKDARIQELLEKIEELQKKLGGNYNPEEDENLQRRIEELELENAELKGGNDKDGLELQEKARTLEAQVSELQAAMREKEQSMASTSQDKSIIEANLKSEQEYLQELKAVTSNFIKRVLTKDQLNGIRARMPSNGDYNTTDDGWELREIQFYLEGFVDLYEGWQSSITSNADVKKFVADAVASAEESFKRQLSESERQTEELTRQVAAAAAKRKAEAELQSQMKVEFTAMKEENEKLRDKIQRDQEKMKAKLDKMKDAQAALTEELETTKSKLSTAESDVEKLKKISEEAGARNFSGGNASGGGGGSGGPWLDERQKLLSQIEEVTNSRNKLESRLKETNVMLRRKGFCLKENTALMPCGAVMPPPPPGQDPNDAFILAQADDVVIDGDLLGLLQQQIRVQHRLHELRHNHQRKLDDMIRKFELLKTGKVTPNSTEGTVSEELLAAKVHDALTTKEKEIANLKAEHDAITEKLVKKLNKKQAELKELESSVVEERNTLAEDHAELKAQYDELQKYNQQQSIEIETVRGQLQAVQSDLENTTRAKESEIAHHKADIKKLLEEVEEYKNRLSAHAKLAEDFSRLQEQAHGADAALKEKMTQLENNRQMVKWSNSMLEAEKKRTQDLEEQVKQHAEDTKRLQEQWRQEHAENIEKLVMINNKRLEEQAAEYQSLLMEEKEKQESTRERLRKARSAAGKAAQRYDEMVLENESLMVQLEDAKLSAMRIFKEKQEAQRDLDAISGKPTRSRGL